MTGVAAISSRRFYIYTFLLLLIIRIPALVLPIIDTDEAGHAVCARELLAGGRLYLDYADNKPPLLYWIYAAILWVGGGSTLIVHWINLAWILAGAWGMKRMLRCVGSGENQARWAYVAYVVGSSVYLPNDMLATNGEQLMNPFLVFAVLAWWLRGSPLVRGVLAGLAGFAGGLCYQKGWIVLFVLVAWALYRTIMKKGSLRESIRFSCGLFLGVAMLVLLAIYALLRTGSLEAAIKWNLPANLSYIRAGLGILSFSLEDRQPHGAVRFVFYLLANALAVRVIWWGFRSRILVRRAGSRMPGLAGFLLFWLLASFLALSLGGRFYGHYFLQLVPAWSGLFGLFMPMALERYRRTSVRPLVYSVLPLVGLALFAYIWVGIGGLESQKPLLHSLAAHARKNCLPGDKIFVWGYASPVYYHSQRRPASRFVYASSLAGYIPGNPHSMNPDTDHTPNISWENWTLLMDDLRKNRPALIYDMSPSGFHYWGKYRMKDYPLSAFVDSFYAPVDTIMNVVAYKRTILCIGSGESR